MPRARLRHARRVLATRRRRWLAGAGVGGLLVFGAAAGLVTGPAGGAVARASLPPSPAPTPLATAPSCSSPAPRTAGGYTAMFARLDPAQWGGGDVAITAPLGDRTVWLFGDTLSTGRFVHSTAIVQRGGCLHVSHGGAQLLPDQHVAARPTVADPSTVYWIEEARALGPDALAVTARAVDIVGTGPWAFHDAGFESTALVSVDEVGDVTFRRWLAVTRSPAPRPGPVIDCEAPAPPKPHHLCYGPQRHPELRLAGGRTLVTVSQNWDDGVLRPLGEYRPLFFAG